MLVTGQPDRYPLKLGGTITLLQGGVIASVATMGAFFALHDQGSGQYVDISLFQTAAGSIEPALKSFGKLSVYPAIAFPPTGDRSGISIRHIPLCRRLF